MISDPLSENMISKHQYTLSKHQDTLLKHQDTLSNKQDKIYSYSLDEAKKSNLLFKHGCVATYGGHIVASGYNTHKNYSSNDNFIDNQCSFHAEMDVLRKIYWRTKNKRKQRRMMKRTKLYISRASNSGSSTNSAPCVKCLQMIQNFNIRKIVFCMDDHYYQYNPQDYQTDHVTFGELALMKRNYSQKTPLELL